MAPTGSVKALVDLLNHFLLDAHGRSRRIVLMVDEAQNLDADVLEQVRLLTNLETATQKLLQIILIGQPELREVLARPELRQLAQRITGRYHLEALKKDETIAYVRHRARVAGATRDLFTAGAQRELHRLSSGVPRIINVIADRALLGAYTLEEPIVNGALVRRAASEVYGRPVLAPWMRWLAIGGAATGVALLGLVLWRAWPALDGSEPAGRRRECRGAAQSAARGVAARGARRRARQGCGIDGPRHRLRFAVLPVGRRVPAGWRRRLRPGAGQGLVLRVAAWLGRAAQADQPAGHPVAGRRRGRRAPGRAGGARHRRRAAPRRRRTRRACRSRSSPTTGSANSSCCGARRAPGCARCAPACAATTCAGCGRGLQQLSGLPTGADGDYFDAELELLVENFQRSRRLAVDGVAGLQTQLVLDCRARHARHADARARRAAGGRMSFILDALRKSEIERQRQSGPSMAEFPVAREDRRLPVALIAIGFLLAVNLAVVLFFMLRGEREPDPDAAPAGAAVKRLPRNPPDGEHGRDARAADRAPIDSSASRRYSRSRRRSITSDPRHSRPMRRTRRCCRTRRTRAPPSSTATHRRARTPSGDAAAGPPRTVGGPARLRGRSREARRVHQRPPLHAGRADRRGSRGRGNHAAKASCCRIAADGSSCRGSSRGAPMNDAVAPILALDGAKLAAALRTGIHRLISREEVINKINVFPVPDGDTGTNLALTLQAVLAALRDGPGAARGPAPDARRRRGARRRARQLRCDPRAVPARRRRSRGDAGRSHDRPVRGRHGRRRDVRAGVARRAARGHDPHGDRGLCRGGRRRGTRRRRRLPAAVPQRARRCARVSRGDAREARDAPARQRGGRRRARLRRIGRWHDGLLRNRRRARGRRRDPVALRRHGDGRLAGRPRAPLVHGVHHHRRCDRPSPPARAGVPARLQPGRRRHAQQGAAARAHQRAAARLRPRRAASAPSAARKPTTCSGSRRWRTTPRGGASPSSRIPRPTCRSRCSRRSTCTWCRCGSISARRATSTRSGCPPRNSSACSRRVPCIPRPRSRRPAISGAHSSSSARTIRPWCTSA